LTKGSTLGTHIGSREILLQYFDIVALVELGSGTFGKTGTNTVVLFIRRKHQLPEPAEHYHNRVEDWFDGFDEDEPNDDMATYQDLHLLKKYCGHIDIPFEHYQTLLNGKPSVELLAHELFQDYKKDFDQSSDIKKLATQKFFKDFSAGQKQAELNKRFLKYLQSIEKDKLFYFVLAYSNPQKVLIVKSPSDNKEQKQFLGYEWSAAKGNEGIKLTTDAQGKHLTPLYDPENRYNADKINALIQVNFLCNPVVIPESLQAYVSLVRLVDLLDYSRKDFDKQFSFSLKIASIVEWSDKYEFRKLSEITLINPSKSEIKDVNENTLISFVEMASVSEKGFIAYREDKLLRDLKKGSYTYFRESDIIIAKITPCMENGKCALATDLTNSLAMGSSEFHVIRPNEKVVLVKYIFALLNREIVRKEAEKNMTGSSGHRRVPASFYESYKIPLPPLEIQNQIMQACEAVDAEVAAAQANIEQATLGLKTLLKNHQLPLEKLENIAVKVNDQIDPNNYEGEVNYIGLENIESQTGRLVGDIRANYNQIKSAKTCFKVNDVLYGKLRPNLNKVYLAKEEGICSTDILVFRFENEYLAKFYAHYMLTDEFNQEVLQGVKGQQLPRTSWKHLSFIKVPYLVNLTIQQQLITEIAAHEATITAAQAIIDAAASKKQAILKQYL
jgi:type I restriction enzyme M protein